MRTVFVCLIIFAGFMFHENYQAKVRLAELMVEAAKLQNCEQPPTTPQEDGYE